MLLNHQTNPLVALVEVDEIRDQQILSPTLSAFGYAALRDVNIIQSL